MKTTLGAAISIAVLPILVNLERGNSVILLSHTDHT